MSCPATSLCAGNMCGGGTSGRWCFGAQSRKNHYTHQARSLPNEDYCDEDDDYTNGAGRLGGWRGLWRELVRRRGGPSKRTTLSSPSSSVGWGRGGRSVTGAAAAPYDPYTYTQNFDEGGWEWAEPGDLTRSFSARYADPSAVTRAVGAPSVGR